MSQPKPPPRSRPPLTWAVVTVLILVPFVALLWVPFYAKAAPKAGGFPFFYWYQLVWIPGVAVLGGLAYLLLARTRRGAGGDAKPAGDGYGQPPPGGWYGQPPGAPGGAVGGTQTEPGTGTGSGTEATS
jgi:Protein of unknown function (DUF3311)